MRCLHEMREAGRSGNSIPALNEYGMELRLTYAGPLRSQQGGNREEQRSRNIHLIRKVFHKQLKRFWNHHPYLREKDPKARDHVNFRHFVEYGFDFLPLVSKEIGVSCEVDILMLRHGEPGEVVYDLDNRVKNIFDALRKPQNSRELWQSMQKTGFDPMLPDESGSEDPFFVLLEDDKLITR